MSYTIVGMFPTNKDADNASNKLDSAGFTKEDYRISRNPEDKHADHEYAASHKTGFWDWLFGENESDKERYNYAATKSNLVTVYTDDLDRAEKARDILNEQGALNVTDFTKDRYTTGNELTTEERARIINKAKNNLYFTEEVDERNSPHHGMRTDMDSQGSSDTF